MKTSKIISILFGSVILFSSFAFAEECDDFRKKSELAPSNVALNKLINEELEKFANLYKGDCERSKLVSAALFSLDKNFSEVGNRLRAKEMHSKGIEYNRRSEVAGVYKNNGEIFCCTTVINISDEIVGIDKVDHFFGNGGLLWEEYEKLQVKNDDVILQMNVQQENGGWGLVGSKIKSYGDLAANWDGFNFYKELFDGPNPYYTCSDGTLKLHRTFEIEKYFKMSWRESANCSAFPQEKAAQAFGKRLKEMGLKCPMQEDDCKKMIELYADNKKVLNSVVSPVCLKKIPIEESVEEPGSISWRDVKNGIGGVKMKDALKIITGAQ